MCAYDVRTALSCQHVLGERRVEGVRGQDWSRTAGVAGWDCRPGSWDRTYWQGSGSLQALTLQYCTCHVFVCLNVKVITWKAGQDFPDDQEARDWGSNKPPFSEIPMRTPSSISPGLAATRLEAGVPASGGCGRLQQMPGQAGHHCSGPPRALPCPDPRPAVGKRGREGVD